MAGSSFRLAGLLALALGSVEGRPRYSARDATPRLPSDPNTISTCTWWWDNADGAIACSDMPFEWGITMENFLLWNPSITVDCGNYLTGRSYCVEAPTGGNEPALTTTTSRAEKPTPKSGNGVETPHPTQPNMVDNCNMFSFAKVGDSCDSIAAGNGITAAQVFEWNPSVGSDCSGLWANNYICVGLIGGSGPAPTTTSSSSTGNGIATPTPTQPGMVDTCDGFYLVKAGDTCASIASRHSISQQQFLEWNPSVGSDCTGLWANNYVCVGRIGATTTSAPTTSTGNSNGIATPTPTQPGMVDNCNGFYFAKAGDTCASIAVKSGISQQQLLSWNPSIGSDCSGLWADNYVCISRIGTPTNPPATTTTTAGNGIATPTPFQSGMVGNCKKFHFVVKGDICASIATKYSITVANFIKWNPAVKSDCTGIWAENYACVGLI
ncbi:hypothetical protein N7491_004261 [Penicillium cf. griseofulvum]|uniref:LysM domain-containing protein n=1 Tax=Penicillium cf. griseofulvum TaxID=2972120 RepID=A0A9W9MPU2_9EURO|nr:hypothetical protein N7472_001565 [Penicillium cf. griseofulvum]KAJ5441855.1 hypothetical protein N7491_004261 [Penicillium cf. griseofulvum]